MEIDYKELVNEFLRVQSASSDALKKKNYALLIQKRIKGNPKNRILLREMEAFLNNKKNINASFRAKKSIESFSITSSIILNSYLHCAVNLMYDNLPGLVNQLLKLNKPKANSLFNAIIRYFQEFPENGKNDSVSFNLEDLIISNELLLIANMLAPNRSKGILPSKFRAELEKGVTKLAENIVSNTSGGRWDFIADTCNLLVDKKDYKPQSIRSSNSRSKKLK